MLNGREVVIDMLLVTSTLTVAVSTSVVLAFSSRLYNRMYGSPGARLFLSRRVTSWSPMPPQIADGSPAQGVSQKPGEGVMDNVEFEQ